MAAFAEDEARAISDTVRPVLTYSTIDPEDDES